ncbi:ergothioneine biosynthesis protein EgtB [Phenylobacterium terrae]|uniref:Ergothioneine biosynthesis protein EgtB n=1 Tax=Phenylobacterium terrae TaxID=2665495 RepID=A0ABW4N3I8_9CAUL
MPPSDDAGLTRPEGQAGNQALDRFRQVRARTLDLARPLSAEDQAVQSMPDASPTKWHLAHTTWFFETFILRPLAPGYRVFDERYGYLFNSYYEAVGARQPRPLRGLITRPGLDEVLAYRARIDQHMELLLESGETPELLELGLAHEEQHQELILMDILHLFAQSALSPAYRPAPAAAVGAPPGEAGWVEFAGGLVEIGHAGSGFCFDNEGPRHKVWLEPYRLADRLVTNGDWLAFIEDGGYRRPEFWLSEGWAQVQAEGWGAPLYWRETEGGWREMTLHGLRPVDPAAPVAHVSYFEAEAFAAWAGRRLPTEAEWEHAAQGPVQGRFLDASPAGRLTPAPVSGRGAGLRQMYGELWQWTRSAYSPYPGFRPAAGAVGEYNGKFMVGQMVLRGGACVTPPGHLRASYRNFFYPHQRWMFSGLRLADDGASKAVSVRPRRSSFASDVLQGLSKSDKSIPPKHFYDAEGSRLFEAICELAEYYPTRTEIALLTRHAAEIAAEAPDGAVLVEFGSGASVKTRILLDAAPRLAAYAPIDISREALEAAAAAIRRDYPALRVEPLVDDFTAALELPAAVQGMPHFGFFPGSTIGNFTPGEAGAFLANARRLLGEGARLLVGIDLVKDEATLVAAYDDPQGVTAAFNKNLLARINRELGGDFDLEAFDHRAVWNAEESRIEMHLVSRADQQVRVLGRRFEFREGESLHTENSYKFTVEGFSRLAAEAGWRVGRSFANPAPAFAAVLLQA